MQLEAFNNLELIPKLMQHIESLENKLMRIEQVIAPPLTTKKGVASYFDVGPRTINNYITKGYLIEGTHFHRKNGKLLFVEDAILNFDKRIIA